MTGTTTSGTTEGRPALPYGELAAALHGSLIGPGERRYDALLDRTAEVVARCADPADVIACVRFAGKHGVGVAMRGGGRTLRSLGVGAEALVIDVSSMRRWSLADLVDTDPAWRLGYLQEPA